jgi:hypothetical protein
MSTLPAAKSISIAVKGSRSGFWKYPSGPAASLSGVPKNEHYSSAPGVLFIQSAQLPLDIR